MIARSLNIVFAFLLAAAVTHGQESRLLFEKANQAYRSGDYRGAVETYEAIIRNGEESASLYYNLGNAYFKLRSLPAAILNYERALRLDPNDEDIQYNLQIANSRVIDKIEPVPQLFFVEWTHSFVHLFTPTVWGVTAIVLLWCAAIAGALLFLFRSAFMQRIVLVVLLILVFTTLIAFAGMYVRTSELTGQQGAIVFAQSIPVKSAPDEQSTDLFVLHEGVKLQLLDAVGAWQKIRLADGKIGWLQEEHLQRI